MLNKITYLLTYLLTTNRLPQRSLITNHLASTDYLTKTTKRQNTYKRKVMLTKNVALMNSNNTLKKSVLRGRTDRAWFSTFYDIRPGNGVGLFLQPRSLYELKLSHMLCSRTDCQFSWHCWPTQSVINCTADTAWVCAFVLYYNHLPVRFTNFSEIYKKECQPTQQNFSSDSCHQKTKPQLALPVVIISCKGLSAASNAFCNFHHFTELQLSRFRVHGVDTEHPPAYVKDLYPMTLSPTHLWGERHQHVCWPYTQPLPPPSVWCRQVLAMSPPMQSVRSVCILQHFCFVRAPGL